MNIYSEIDIVNQLHFNESVHEQETLIERNGDKNHGKEDTFNEVDHKQTKKKHYNFKI